MQNLSFFSKPLLILSLFGACALPLTAAERPSGAVVSLPRLFLDAVLYFSTQHGESPCLIHEFIRICCQDKMTQKDIDGFLKSSEFQSWLDKCEAFWTVEDEVYNEIGQRRRQAELAFMASAFEQGKDSYLDEFKTSVKKRCMVTKIDDKKQRIRGFLKRIILQINHIYKNIAPANLELFKLDITEFIKKINGNFIHFATPIVLPRCDFFVFNDENDKAAAAMVFYMSDDCKMIRLEYIDDMKEFSTEALLKVATAFHQEYFAENPLKL